MKTILQINKFHWLKGGAERYYFNLSKLLKQRGHKVVHFSMWDERNVPSEFEKYFVSNIDISKPHFDLAGIRKVCRLIYSLESKHKIEQLIRDTKPDIAHIHNIYHQLSPSILPVLKKFYIPVVMSLHDYKLISPNYQFLCKEKVCEHKHNYYKEIIHRSVKNSYLASAVCVLEMAVHNFLGLYERNIDVFLSPSEFMKQKFVEYGFPETRIKVLPYALDLESYQNVVSENREKYILYFGRLSKEKGTEVLLSAVKNIKNSVKIKIVGDGPLVERLKIKLQEERMHNVELVGFRSGQDLKNIITNSLMVVVPSIWYENSPLAIYESMALSRTVVGSRIGGIPELIKDGVTGLLFEAGDYRELATKIDYLLSNREVLIKMGEAAKVESLKFGFDRHYEKIMEAYNQLL